MSRMPCLSVPEQDVSEIVQQEMAAAEEKEGPSSKTEQRTSPPRTLEGRPEQMPEHRVIYRPFYSRTTVGAAKVGTIAGMVERKGGQLAR